MPLVLAAVHGETLNAQVKLLANARAGGPCPVCLFNEDERQWQDREAIFSCTGGDAQYRAEPTRSTSFLCSLAADLAMAQAVRWFLGLGASVGDTELTWSAYTHRVLIAPLVARASCPLEHAAWQRAAVAGRAADATVDELLAAAHMTRRPGVTLAVEGHGLAEKAICCGHETPIGRFVAVESSVAGSCPRCGADLVAPPYFVRKAVPLALLPRKVPLAELGAAAAKAVLVSDGSRSVLVHEAETAARKSATSA
jgi:hypothetical protein